MVGDILSAPIERSCGRQSQLSGGLDALKISNCHVSMPLTVRLSIHMLDSFNALSIGNVICKNIWYRRKLSRMPGCHICALGCIVARPDGI